MHKERIHDLKDNSVVTCQTKMQREKIILKKRISRHYKVISHGVTCIILIPEKREAQVFEVKQLRNFEINNRQQLSPQKNTLHLVISYSHLRKSKTKRKSYMKPQGSKKLKLRILYLAKLLFKSGAIKPFSDIKKKNWRIYCH